MNGNVHRPFIGALTDFHASFLLVDSPLNPNFVHECYKKGGAFSSLFRAEQIGERGV